MYRWVKYKWLVSYQKDRFLIGGAILSVYDHMLIYQNRENAISYISFTTLRSVALFHTINQPLVIQANNSKSKWNQNEL